MKKFSGFTLTELMVALAVIGILTAVVTPAVMKIKPNKNKMMVKKAYYTAENIVSSLINNQLYYPDMSAVCLDNSMANAANGIYCAGGFDYTENVTDSDGETYGGNTKFAKLFGSKLNVQTGDCSAATGCTTTDGMTWYLPSWATSDGTSTLSSNTIIVDVNGAGKGPDCTQDDTTNGCSEDDFDEFRIVVREDGRMSINSNDIKAIEYISINASVAKD